MRVAFFSNFLNHHQLPFCLAMEKLTHGGFVFVATEPIPQERLDMGYADINSKYPFVLRTYESFEAEKEAETLALTSDVIITGSAPEKYTRMRIEQGKITFRYSERVYKRGLWRMFSPKGCRYMKQNHTRYKNAPLYMLCASAYAAADYGIQHAYIDKTYKWGYFPETKQHDLDMLMQNKHSASANEDGQHIPLILWAGRLIQFKHPEAAVNLAKNLKAKGYMFRMKIIGNGVLEQKLRTEISQNNLSECVEMTGAMSPEKVRENMERADIFLFTSDYSEGWGAVMNEAMNSGCAVVASHAVGSVPFLLQNGENGLIYRNGRQKDLNRQVMRLLDDAKMREKLGMNAYTSIAHMWNAQTAAERFLKLYECLSKQKDIPWYEGPCSQAKRVFQWQMYKYAVETEDRKNAL